MEETTRRGEDIREERGNRRKKGGRKRRSWQRKKKETEDKQKNVGVHSYSHPLLGAGQSGQKTFMLFNDICNYIWWS